LDSFDFYSALYSYSRPPPSSQSTSMEEDEEPELGPDGDLVSAMISTAVIPRLCKLIEGGGFDPYSAKHVRRMVDLAEQVEASVARDNLKFHVSLLRFSADEKCIDSFAQTRHLQKLSSIHFVKPSRKLKLSSLPRCSPRILHHDSTHRRSQPGVVIFHGG
jgi:hypothetical protein